MQIFINDEEVVCNSKMVINKQLSNTNSVILNNVYPKSWENDKDYTSRFYMPKDYSNCKIIDETINTSTTYDLSNNIRFLNNRSLDNSKVSYYEGMKLVYIKLEKGKTYSFNVTAKYSYTGIFETDSLDINSVVSGIVSVNAGTQTISITPTKKYVVASYNYNNGTPYIEFNSVKLTVSDNLLFSGVIKNSGNIELNPRFPHYSTLQALEYSNFLSEGETLNYVLEEQSISEAIKTIISGLDGFLVGDILINDDIIAPYNCNEKTPFDVFQYLAEISGSLWITKSLTEKTVLISFYAPDNIPSAENIEYTTEYFKEKKIQDISYSYSSNNYRNKQIIVNDKAKASVPQIEMIIYEGNDIYVNYSIDTVKSIKNGSTEYSVSINNSGEITYFYYDYGSNKISVNSSIPTGTVLTIEYYPIVALREVSYNQTEIDRIKGLTSGSGIISRYEKRTDTNNAEALNQIAQSYITYKSVPEIILKVVSYDKDIFEIGSQTIFEAPLQDLRTNYLVKSKNIEMIIAGNQRFTRYVYELSSSFNDENAINFFDNQRRKIEGNLNEGEYISRYIDIPSMTNITFYGATIEEMSTSDILLDRELETEI